MACGIVLLAHGSRDPRWREPVEAVARRIQDRAPLIQVRCAYLEGAKPDLAAAVSALVSEGVAELDVLPMFLGMGKHARDDLPRLVESVTQARPGLTLRVHPSIGESERLLDLLADLALAAIDSPARNSNS